MILWPLPDQRHLYMLVAGVMIGLLAGPSVLGRFAPELHDTMFVGSGDTSKLDQARSDLLAFRDEYDEQQSEIAAIMGQAKFLEPGDSPHQSAMNQIDEKIKGWDKEEKKLIDDIEAAQIPIALNQQAHLNRLSGMLTVMVLLVVLLFAAESILSPQRDEIEDGQAELSPLLSRLVTIRYGLIAGWLLIMLAQPHWLHAIDPWFGGLLLLVILIAGFVPLGKKAE